MASYESVINIVKHLISKTDSTSIYCVTEIPTIFIITFMLSVNKYLKLLSVTVVGNLKYFKIV